MTTRTTWYSADDVPAAFTVQDVQRSLRTLSDIIDVLDGDPDDYTADERREAQAELDDYGGEIAARAFLKQLQHADGELSSGEIAMLEDEATDAAKSLAAEVLNQHDVPSDVREYIDWTRRANDIMADWNQFEAFGQTYYVV